MPLPRDLAKGGIEIRRAIFLNQGLGFQLGRRLSEKEDDLGRGSGVEPDLGLQGATGVEAGTAAVGQGPAGRQAQRPVERAVAADELRSVPRPSRLPAVQIKEGNALAKRIVPRVRREEGTSRRIDLGHDERGGRRAIGTEHPFDISGDGDAPFARRQIGDLQPRDLDWIADRHKLQQFKRDLVRCVRETAEPLSVRRRVRRGFLADRQCGRPPQSARLLVAHINRFARCVADGIVRPGRELVLLAVHRPGKAAPLGRDLKAKTGIGDDIDPGRRRGLAAIEDCQVFAAIVDKAAEAVEKFHLGIRRGRHRRRGRQREACRQRDIWIELADAV